MEKTREQLEQELSKAESALLLQQKLSDERELNDERYARKMIESIVFTIVGIFALAALYVIFAKAGLPKP